MVVTGLTLVIVRIVLRKPTAHRAFRLALASIPTKNLVACVPLPTTQMQDKFVNHVLPNLIALLVETTLPLRA
jgi:hypothetical protein